jgi:hypothetical protein
MNSIKHIKNIDSCLNKKLSLPNSVYKYNNKIIIADSGNHRICVLEEESEFELCGQFGLGKYKLKEPVYAAIDNENIYVCDWHNHRVVIYDLELKSYINEIGILSGTSDGLVKKILKFFINMASRGTFLNSHFLLKNTQPKLNLLKKSFSFLEALLYYLVNFRNIDFRVKISKPNGCIILGEQLIFTQKDNASISVYDLKKGKICKEVYNGHKDINFGRLGQIAHYKKYIYVCDETHNLIWIFNEKFELNKKITLTSYNIFSISISDKYIATCGSTSFSIFNHNYTLLFESNGNGEYHGIFIDNNSLYVANRLKNRIEIYELLV